METIHCVPLYLLHRIYVICIWSTDFAIPGLITVLNKVALCIKSEIRKRSAIALAAAHVESVQTSTEPELFLTSGKKRPLHFNECFHFRTHLFDSKCQSDLLTLIAMNPNLNLRDKLRSWIKLKYWMHVLNQSMKNIRVFRTQHKDASLTADSLVG